VQNRIVYIVGAGISGLTLALALARFGAHVVVLERNANLSEFGAGLQISPNARRILDRLGLGEALTAKSLVPTGIDIYPFGRDTPLVTMALGQTIASRFGAPYAVMHRADLAEILFKATKRFANIEVLFNTSDWMAVPNEAGVTMSYDEAGQFRSGRAFALVGADGVHSRTRTQIIGGAPATGLGRAAWRTQLPFEALEGTIALDRVSVLFAPHYHVVCYPLPHRREVNIALFAPAKDDAPHLRGRQSPRIAKVLDAASTSWTQWPLYSVEAPSWHKGPIGLIGDAAHAMVPFQAQGAAMGIEDAAILAPLLMSEPDAPSAFASYEAMRQARVSRVAKVSADNGRIFHMRWPMSAARDAVIAAHGTTGHLNRLDWLYGYDAETQSPR